jgi:uncharacterized lipoprotein YajG
MRKYVMAARLLVVLVALALMAGCMLPPDRVVYAHHPQAVYPVYVRPSPAPRRVVVRVHAPPPPRARVHIRVGR